MARASEIFARPVDLVAGDFPAAAVLALAACALVHAEQVAKIDRAEMAISIYFTCDLPV